MHRVKRQSLPFYARPFPDWREGDFLETFGVQTGVSAAQAHNLILPPPRWIQCIGRIANAISSCFGLITFDPATGPPVTKQTNHEVAFGEASTHVDYQITLVSTGRCLYISTWARPKTFRGTVYLVLARPVHNLAVTNALRRAAA